LDSNLSLVALDGLRQWELCSPDYTTINVSIANTGVYTYDFSTEPLAISLRLTEPVVFDLDTVITTGTLLSGESMQVALTQLFPIMVAGEYKVKVWMHSQSDIVPYDDTLLSNYISGRFGLPVDEDFSNGLPMVLEILPGNTSAQWQIISRGTGADTVVEPQFGTGMLSFRGSIGSMTTLSTRQMDLSRTIQPSVSFWYFHDTIPCEDYTDVRVTVDGGVTYNTLFSLTKYDAAYGWKQYSMDLPPYAVNQCVILTFEAMEKSRSGNVTQYIDRILITARQDIAVDAIITSELDVCDLENKDLKVVMHNRSNPVLNYALNPTTLTLEVTDKVQTVIYDTLLSSGILGSDAYDTLTLATGFNFAKGTYNVKAYFSSVLDVDRDNDTLVSAIVIDPALSVQVESASGGNTNCLAGEADVYQSVIITNTGNMDLSNIGLILQIDTGETGSPAYVIIRETFTGTIVAKDSVTYTFNTLYNAPWHIDYYAGVTAYLLCDTLLASDRMEIPECVDTKDLRIISIDNPVIGTSDHVGSSIQVAATLNNRSDYDEFTNANITVLVTNSQGVEVTKFREVQTVGILATVSHPFVGTYTVPADTVYYLTVYTDSYDNYTANDTIRMRRETDFVGIETLSEDGFTLSQNIPNPVTNNTRIDYSIPERGEVIFTVHSISGQLLYSKTIEAVSGKQSLELNTSTLAAGVYIYSVEYKGQRLIKRMSVQK
jgi:hypothetical protein